jgi:hypothetical protein
MNFATSSGLLLLGLFLLPVLVGGCLPYGRDGMPWYEARRDPTGLAPDPATTPEAVIQVYAARAVSWRGVFSMHTWIAVKPTGAPRYTRYEVLGFGVANGAPAVRIDRMGPDNYWFGARPQIILDRRGPDVDAMIEGIAAAVARYPYPHEYRAWPGPNSNTFTAYIARQVPERSAKISCPKARCLPRLPAAAVSGFALRSCGHPPRRRGGARGERLGSQCWPRRRRAGTKAAGDRPIRTGPLTR